MLQAVKTALGVAPTSMPVVERTAVTLPAAGSIRRAGGWPPVAMVIAALYIAMCLLLSQFAHYLERRTRRTRRIDPAAPVDDTEIEMQQVRAGTP